MDLVGPLGIPLRAVSVGKSSGPKHSGGESYGGHFLYTLSTVTRGPEEKALPLPSGSGVLDMAEAMTTIHVYSGSHTLRPSSAPPQPALDTAST